MEILLLEQYLEQQGQLALALRILEIFVWTFGVIAALLIGVFVSYAIVVRRSEKAPDPHKPRSGLYAMLFLAGIVGAKIAIDILMPAVAHTHVIR